MLKSVRVPQELVALMQRERQARREVGVPLYLPAFEAHLLEARVASDDDVDHGVEAGGLTIGPDEDDDFY